MEQSALQISSVHLVHLFYQINSNFNPKDTKGVEISINCKLFRKIQDTTCAATLAVDVFDQKLTEEMPFCILMAFQANFKWEKDTYTAEQLKNLLSSNVASILYSYARPFVVQMSALSNMPPLTLPVMDMRDVEVVDVD